MQWKGWGYMAPAPHTLNVKSISPSDLAPSSTTVHST